MAEPTPPQVALIGGGMIAHDQILPSLYQLQRLGVIGTIHVCAQHGRTVKALAEAEHLKQAFPGSAFALIPTSMTIARSRSYTSR